MDEIPKVFQGTPDTAVSSYDPDAIYTASTNSHDHSQEIRTKFPPAVAGWVSSFISRRTVPQYRTNADFVRDAVHHRMQHWVEKEADWEGADLLARERLGLIVEQALEQQRVYQDLLENHQKVLDGYRGHGDWAGVRAYLMSIESCLDGYTTKQRERLEQMIAEGYEMCERGERLGF